MSLPAQAQTPVTPTTLDQALALWNIQEALLQQYRVIFITTQSILISFAATLTDSVKPVGSMIALCAVSAVTLWLWWTLCNARGKSVFFCQAMALKIERGVTITKPLRELKKYQENGSKVLREDEDYRSLISGGTMTRGKMERWLPGMYILAWLVLWVTRYWPLC